ncbi:MAG: PEP-CTERM sorting domain-containing protein [Dechloromonas sp.]|nr:MAG: PEP-CTERM sorting domain-containing protein [Dechloromonas sp.]
MKKTLIALLIAAALPLSAQATPSFVSATKLWTYSHVDTGTADTNKSEIPAYDAKTNTLWVAGVGGVDVLNAQTGARLQRIDVSTTGSVNSVAIKNGVAAFAIESSTRTSPGVVQLFDTQSRTQMGGNITVGALPDMLTFTPDGKRLLVANEGTPDTYGARIGTTTPRSYGAATNDPQGSVSIIDIATRSVTTAKLDGVTETGSLLRKNTGMDFEPEYIAVNKAGTKAYVGLQEANGMGVLNLLTNTFEKIIGLGAKDFNAPGNEIDPRNNSTIAFGNYAAKGLYMPDGMATFQAGGKTYVVMANEGDFREDDGDRSAASSLGASGDLANLRIANDLSSSGNLYAAGARSFSIRDEDGKLIYDSGAILDKEAAKRGIYDDGRSRDKGVEPEGVTILEIAGRTFAFVGLERTTKSAVAVFDITDPESSKYVDMIVSDGDLSPEGLIAYGDENGYFLAVANEVSDTTSLFRLNFVPEPGSLALALGGLGLLGWSRRLRSTR